MYQLFRRFLDLWYPPCCLVCGRPLLETETHICLSCLYHLPHLSYLSFRENEAVARLAGRLPFDKAVAALRYQKESSVQTLFESFKYQGNKDLAYYLTKVAARPLYQQSFFDDIDVIVPLPLHDKKLKMRGYNQAACIAQALSSLSALPVDENIVRRVKATDTQTRKNRWQRQESVNEVFALLPEANLNGKHVLLVDDVLTTGASLSACGRELWRANPAKLSFFALALA